MEKCFGLQFGGAIQLTNAVAILTSCKFANSNAKAVRISDSEGTVAKISVCRAEAPYT